MSCSNRVVLEAVTVAQFETFVASTGYITDAERYGWSIVQQNVFDYKTVSGADWRRPDGVHPTRPNLPVTQVSYQDAQAYCMWAGARLPSYDEYWRYAKRDKMIISDNLFGIMPTAEVSVIGNVWDLTEPLSGETIRLAGGSIFCSVTTCNGTQESRELYVDKETGNYHIGFSVIKPVH